MWRGRGVRASMAHIAGGAPTARGLRGKVHAYRAATLWPGCYRGPGLRSGGVAAGSPSRNYGEAHSVVGCHTVVEDLTAAGLQDDKCIEVRAVTTVKKSVANHPRVVPNEGQSPRANPEQDGFRGPGTSAAGSVRLACRASVSAPRARVDRMGISAGWLPIETLARPQFLPWHVSHRPNSKGTITTEQS